MIEIIPAIDILGGQIVRVKAGISSPERIYQHDYLSYAQKIFSAGIKKLHFVDLDTLRGGPENNLHLLAEITENTDLKVQYCGGTNSHQEFVAALSAGATAVCIGDVAISQPQLVREFIQEYQASKIVVSADQQDGKIMFQDWSKKTELAADGFIQDYCSQGVSKFICTDVSKDGSLAGINQDLYQKIRQEFPGIEITASGGISSLDHLQKLSDFGINAAIIGRALHEDRLSLADICMFSKS